MPPAPIGPAISYGPSLCPAFRSITGSVYLKCCSRVTISELQLFVFCGCCQNEAPGHCILAQTGRVVARPPEVDDIGVLITPDQVAAFTYVPALPLLWMRAIKRR